MSTCKTCNRVFVYNRVSGHRTDKCNSCNVNIRRFKLKERCVEYLGGKCSKCSYNRCIIALEFHHLDPSLKKFRIAGNHCIRWESIKEELDKCILLCANCHREEEFIVASAKGRPAALYPASPRLGRNVGSNPTATTNLISGVVQSEYPVPEDVGATPIPRTKSSLSCLLPHGVTET